jgi:anti-anti-sigma factor
VFLDGASEVIGVANPDLWNLDRSIVISHVDKTHFAQHVPMHFTIDQQDATTIFRLKEAKLDSSNSSALKAEFLILAQPDVESLIVDLSEVTYIDSAGLSALLLAERQQSAHGGDVRLVGANESVQSLLRLTQLDRVFPLFATTKEAVDAEFEDEPELPASHANSIPMRAGAIAAGGSLGAAALAAIMMDHSDDPDMMGDEEEFDEDDDDDFDEDDDEFDDDLDEEDDDEDGNDEEDAEEPSQEDPDPKIDEEPEPAVIEEDVDAEDFDDDFDDEDEDDDDDDDDLL